MSFETKSSLIDEDILNDINDELHKHYKNATIGSEIKGIGEYDSARLNLDDDFR